MASKAFRRMKGPGLSLAIDAMDFPNTGRGSSRDLPMQESSFSCHGLIVERCGERSRWRGPQAP